MRHKRVGQREQLSIVQRMRWLMARGEHKQVCLVLRSRSVELHGQRYDGEDYYIV